jgi:triosephosphate isomerase (TIM)
VSDGLRDIDVLPGLVIAYEPVWAIGTGVAAHGGQAQEAIAFIRSLVRSLAGGVADQVRILYGGSVTHQNIAEFMAEPDVDGGLVGGASLSAEAFATIVERSVRAKAIP